MKAPISNKMKLSDIKFRHDGLPEEHREQQRIFKLDPVDYDRQEPVYKWIDEHYPLADYLALEGVQETLPKYLGKPGEHTDAPAI
jgi:hypothetical protein